MIKGFIEGLQPNQISEIPADKIRDSIIAAHRADYITAVDTSENHSGNYRILEVRWNGYHFIQLAEDVDAVEKAEREIIEKSGLDCAPLDLLLEYLKVQLKIRKLKNEG